MTVHLRSVGSYAKVTHESRLGILTEFFENKRCCLLVGLHLFNEGVYLSFEALRGHVLVLMGLVNFG